MGLKVTFHNPARGILYGEFETPADLLSMEKISLDIPCSRFEFAASADGTDAPTPIFTGHKGHTHNASYDSVITLKDDENPNREITLRDYLKYAADRVVEEGHTTAGLDIEIYYRGIRKELNYSDLTR